MKLLQWLNSPLSRLLFKAITKTCIKHHNGLSSVVSSRKYVCSTLQELLTNYNSLQILLYKKKILCWQNNILRVSFILACPSAFPPKFCSYSFQSKPHMVTSSVHDRQSAGRMKQLERGPTSSSSTEIQTL